MAVDSEDNLYKVDGTPNVTKFSDTGEDLADTLDGGQRPGLVIDPSSNNLYVDESGSSISQFALDCGENCTPLDSFGSAVLTGAQGLSVDPTTPTILRSQHGERQCRGVRKDDHSRRRRGGFLQLFPSPRSR